MSQFIQNPNQNIILEKLPEEWTLWFSYSSDTQNDTNYGSNLMKIQTLNYWNDFALVWNWVSLTDKYFTNPENGTFNKYKFGNEQRKVDSINFFKLNNQPQWEYGNNPKYGYFNFGIDRNDERVNDIYEATVFLALGKTQQISENIIGVRIVDLAMKPNHPSRARVQIWVDFRHENTKQSLERLSIFQTSLQKYYLETIAFNQNQIRFFNISNQETEEEKNAKRKNLQNHKNTSNRQKYRNQKH